ncbi:MAG: catalase [Deltaproteobacteria bacterium]|jgi:catalase|nr:catalase [Deltaproteobacteria bacterium]
MADQSKKHLTTVFGSPITNDNISQTAGEGGPILLQDVVLLEKLAHFGRERIPERVVHAKGAGAFGVFKVTADVTKWTCADFLSKVGKETEVFMRFSTVGGERGFADADRDPRGFACKFYTAEGNYDLVGNNTPIFFIRDPMKFPDFIHTQKRRPDNNLHDNNIKWDFWSLTPESLHQVAILFSDRGVPANFRTMHGFGSHTYLWYNEKNEYFWVKYHWRTKQGIANLTRQEATKISGEDPDHATRDFYTAIADKEYPSWDLQMQILTPDEVKKFAFDPFDVTKVWYHADAPLMTIGTVTLDKAPKNYFQEVEQSAFNPSSFVPGIGPSPDKLLQGRLFSYHDTHLHRLGANYHQIPVNSPRGMKEGASPNERDSYLADSFPLGVPNYWPNSFGGPGPKPLHYPEVPVSGAAHRYPVEVTPVDFVQADALYSRVMTQPEKDRFLDNVADSLHSVIDRIKLRSIVLFYKMNPEAAKILAEATKSDYGQVEKLAMLTYDELVKATEM